jgi:N-acetyl sugar amidotransferase
MITYCTRCVLPSTKPDLTFDDEGVCSACRYFERRPQVDWGQRESELREILLRHRAQSRSRWDCIVPVSGGKDSTFQVIKLLELGATPLCVTATTCELSDIGRRNIENIKNLGVDHLEFSPNPLVRRELNRIGLTRVGDISWPEHVGIFTIPVQVAVHYGISLLVWGENSQHEYGGPATAADNQVLDRGWLEEFGGLLGLRVSDIPAISDITPEQLLPYTYPSDADIEAVGVTGLFLGYFMPWDGFTNVLVSQAHGFETYPHAVETTFLSYENLDNYQAGIHDYFKFLKFGFGRASDHASLHVRRGRLSRSDAVEIVKRVDGRYPWTYLGRSLEDIIRPLGMSISDFDEVCDEFTNPSLFEMDSSGSLRRQADRSLVKVNYDNR